MFKKIGVSLLVCAFAFSSYSIVNAESFTYTLSVEQPVLAVAVTSSAETTEHLLQIDRNNPTFKLDTITIENTGDVDSITSTKGTITRTDGGTETIVFTGGTPTSPSQLLAIFYQPGTTTIYQSGSYLSGSEKDVFTVNKGQTITFDIGLKFHPDFNAAFSLKADFNSRAK